MQELTVIGVEDGALIVSSDGGERFRIVIDEVLQSRLRQSIAASQEGKKVSPREIQTHIRAGLSAFEVAELTGASVDYVERFEGPVVAERQFMVESALKVPVQPTTPADPLGEEPLTTFGDALQERLEGLDAKDVRWASWKDESGWIVKLTFTSREIDHDARWQFDPKRHVLTPLNSEATTLSRHGELTEGLIPRLRAVSLSDSAEPGDARFDSGAVAPLERVPAEAPAADGDEPADGGQAATGTVVSTAPAGSPAVARPSHKDSSRPFDAYAAKRAPDVADTADHNQTADLLEALRRRRGERESAAFTPPAEESNSIFSRPGVSAPLDGGDTADTADTPLPGLEAGSIDPTGGQGPVISGTRGSSGSSGQGSAKPPAPRRQRAAMPSWDEIVFGARSEDDPA
ncbi:MAG: septation protein SepH [Herbiconiux sp.]|nr:septation protein SepH [Herbiconiux sp.]